MNEDDVKTQTTKAIREQLNRLAYRDALRTRYKAVANDEAFEDLLKRLDDSEPNKEE